MNNFFAPRIVQHRNDIATYHTVFIYFEGCALAFKVMDGDPLDEVIWEGDVKFSLHGLKCF
jgi:hypothetical protein